MLIALVIIFSLVTALSSILAFVTELAANLVSVTAESAKSSVITVLLMILADEIVLRPIDVALIPNPSMSDLVIFNLLKGISLAANVSFP